MRRTLKLSGLGLALVAVLAVCTAAGVNIIANHVNSATGYQVGGAAGSSGQGLCSDGTNYNTPCNVGPGTLYYQTVDSAGSAQTQRAALDFSSDFTLSDSSSPSKTVVALANPFTSGSTSAGWWVKRSTGTITEHGSITVTNGSGTLITGAIAFPLTFPSALESLVVSGGGQADGSDDAETFYSRNQSTTGAVAVMRCSVNIGGSGCASISNTVPIYWIAIGR